MSGGFRSYEVYQRMRLRDTTADIRPRQLTSEQYLRDPYPLVAILREEYPCYRDWPGNAFWVSRYDDVTSVFVDDANYGSRSRLWRYGRAGWGTDLGNELVVLRSVADALDAHGETVARAIVGELEPGADLATELCARYPIELLGRVLDLPPDELADFAVRYLVMQRGAGWVPGARLEGLAAMDELAAFFEPLLAKRAHGDATDLISAVAAIGGSARDLVVTLLEADHETLHGALANTWFLLLAHPEQLALVRAEPRLVKYAYLEALRHSAPVISADRFCRHEVERFGRLLPEGALVRCSAAAANRDPRVFDDPDSFLVERRDLCQREPRGMYRADGLASGISFGTGPPSKLPAEPEDRPRSRYALTRDLAVAASTAVLESMPALALAPGTTPSLRALRLGEMHTCWDLRVVW